MGFFAKSMTFLPAEVHRHVIVALMLLAFAQESDPNFMWEKFLVLNRTDIFFFF